MIEINLLPEDLRKREAMKLTLPDAATLQKFALGLALFFGIQILISMFALFQKVEILSIRTQIAALKQENKEILERKAETALMANRLQQIEWMTKRPFHWSALLNSLSHSMTKGVWLRELSVADVSLPGPGQAGQGSKAPATNSPKVRSLKLQGSSMGEGHETSYIGKFIKGLKEGSPFGQYFSQIELMNINQRKIKDFDVYDFELICVFKKEGA